MSTQFFFPSAKKTTSLRSPKFHTITRCSILPALKEWAPVGQALCNGDQTVLLRKGGIKEPLFTPQSSSFLIFPTAFHTHQNMLKPGGLIQTRYGADCLLDPKQQSYLAFDCVATLTGCWKTTDPKVLLALDALHIVGPEFLEARLRWKPTQPLTIMEVRAYR